MTENNVIKEMIEKRETNEGDQKKNEIYVKNKGGIIKMNQRMENIYKLTRYGTELKIKIPTTVLKHPEFKEQQESLETLKKDPQLAISEENDKTHVDTINGVKIIDDYTIITIKRLNEKMN